jgi:hypothetical protein
MGFIQKTIDVKKLARILKKRRADPEWKSKFIGAATQKDLTPVMLDVYFQIMRQDKIIISELNFAEISESDIDDLESVLADNPCHELFQLGEVFREFVPAAPDARVFI